MRRSSAQRTAHRISSAPELAALGEFGVIDCIEQTIGRVQSSWSVGIGDDAAISRVLHAPPLVALDVLVDGVHFRRQWSRPQEIARKALTVNASDIAAMGGAPHGALLGLALPEETSAAWVRDLARGLRDASRELGLPLVGGDTVRSNTLALTVAVVGTCAPQVPPMRRAGVRAGDILCVTGALGGAAAGLAFLERHARARDCRTPRARAALLARASRAQRPALRDALSRHFEGRARLDEGAALVRIGAHAAIDLSDGLASDAGHLARASRVTLTLDEAALPLHPATRIAARLSHTTPEDFALTGGDDYELLVALAPEQWRRARTACTRAGRAGLTIIGHATRGPGCVMLRRADGRTIRLTASGYDHFRER